MLSDDFFFYILLELHNLEPFLEATFQKEKKKTDIFIGREVRNCSSKKDASLAFRPPVHDCRTKRVIWYQALVR